MYKVDTIQKLFAMFESPDFRQRAQIMNSLASFTNSVESSVQFKDMLEQYKPSPDEGTKLLRDRIEKILSLANDGRYLHKYDSAIGAYLYLYFKLSPVDFDEYLKILNLPANTWWSKQMLSVLSKFSSSYKTEYPVRSVQDNTPVQLMNVGTDNSATTRLQGVFK